MPTGSGAWVFRTTIQEYNGMGVWGALAQSTLEAFDIAAAEGNAWICIRNADGNDLLILASGKWLVRDWSCLTKTRTRMLVAMSAHCC